MGFLSISALRTNSVNNHVSGTITVPAGSNRLLVLGIDWYVTSGPSDVSTAIIDPGGGDQASFANIASTAIQLDGGKKVITLWILKEADIPTAGVYTVDVTISKIVTALAWRCWALDDMDQGTPDAALGASATKTVEVVMSGAGTILALAYDFANGVSFTPDGSDYTPTEDAEDSINSAYTQALLHGAVAGAGTYTTGWSWTQSTYYGITAVGLLAASVSVNPIHSIQNAAWIDPA